MLGAPINKLPASAARLPGNPAPQAAITIGYISGFCGLDRAPDNVICGRLARTSGHYSTGCGKLRNY